MWKKILGDSPHTTLVGAGLAGLIVAQDLLEKGVTDWWRIVLAVLIAALGRLSADSKQ